MLGLSSPTPWRHLNVTKSTQSLKMHLGSLIFSPLFSNQLFTIHFESNSPSSCHLSRKKWEPDCEISVEKWEIVHFEMHHNSGFYLLSPLSPPFCHRGSTACVCVRACGCYRASRPRKADKQCATHLGNFPQTVGLLPVHSLTLNQPQSATYSIKCLQL